MLVTQMSVSVRGIEYTGRPSFVKRACSPAPHAGSGAETIGPLAHRRVEAAPGALLATERSAYARGASGRTKSVSAPDLSTSESAARRSARNASVQAPPAPEIPLRTILSGSTSISLASFRTRSRGENHDDSAYGHGAQAKRASAFGRSVELRRSARSCPLRRDLLDVRSDALHEADDRVRRAAGRAARRNRGAYLGRARASRRAQHPPWIPGQARRVALGALPRPGDPHDAPLLGRGRSDDGKAAASDVHEESLHPGRRPAHHLLRCRPAQRGRWASLANPTT